MQHEPSELQSTTVERVARAIYEKRNGCGCRPWGTQTKAHKEPYLNDARAAIEALLPEDIRGLTHSLTEQLAGEAVGNFTPWEGGDSPPVKDGVVVGLLRGGGYRGPMKVGAARWNHLGTATDIVSYVLFPGERND